MMRNQILLALLLCLLCIGSRSQTLSKVPPEEAARQIDKQVVPDYPPIAKAARIQGVVRIQIRVTENGEVTNLRVISGHPMLVQAAMDAVRKWKYKPFLRDGQPVSIETIAEVNFGGSISAKSAELDKKFETARHICENGLREQSSTVVESCRASQALAERLPEKSWLDKSMSAKELGLAYFGARQFNEALDWFKTELAMIEKHEKPDEAEVGEAARDVAMGLHIVGNFKEAEPYYLRSLTIIEGCLNRTEWDEMRRNYRKEMAYTLQLYIKMLEKQGRNSEAEAASKRMQTFQD